MHADRCRSGVLAVCVVAGVLHAVPHLQAWIITGVLTALWHVGAPTGQYLDNSARWQVHP